MKLVRHALERRMRRMKHTGEAECFSSPRRVTDANLPVGETVILLHPPFHVVGVSIGMERGHQQNDGLADG